MPSDDDAFQIAEQTLAEPFRIKVVEHTRLPNRLARERILRDAFFSVMYLDSTDVFIDLGTDSGTGAMSDEQWAGMMRGDEAYVRSRSFGAFDQAVREMTGLPYVIPTHQGRAAENILMDLLVTPGQKVLGNGHFDTTGAHVRRRGALPLDLVGDTLWHFDEQHPFKGNFDLVRLDVALKHYHETVPFIAVTVTNNLACSAPVSMENIREVRARAERYGIPLYFDASRIAENAYFIQTREAGYRNVPIKEIVRQILAHGEGCWMSAKKDGLVNIGGFIAVRGEALAQSCRERLVLFEGFPTYGGLARRDLEAIAIGLGEGTEDAYLSHRTGLVAHLGRLLECDVGVRVSKPIGGSGVFVDVASIYPHLRMEDLPGITFASDLYLEGAIRIGAFPFHLSRVRPPEGQIVEERFDLVRLAIPRRVYTKSHLEYVAKVVGRVKERAHKSRGYRIVHMPDVLGHFFAKFEPR